MAAANSSSKKANKVKKQSKVLSEDEALSYVKSMRLSLTGARVGDVIVGAHNMNRSALMRVVDTAVRPCRKDLDDLRVLPFVWTKFLQALQRFPFFATMSTKERETWLEVNQSDGTKDHYVGDEATRLLLIQPGSVPNGKTTGLCDLEPEILNRLAVEPTSPGEIERLCAPNHTTQAAHPVLIFIKRLWCLDEASQPINPATFQGPAIHVGRGTWCRAWSQSSTAVVESLFGQVKQQLQQPHSWYLVSFDGTEVALVVPASSSMQTLDLSDGNLPAILREAGIGSSIPDDATFAALVQRCVAAHVGVTPSGFKSLIQKVIRCQAHSVRLNRDDDESAIIPADIELGVALCLETRNKGSFVPDIQRFVSGLEAATKRLAVTCFEDASPLPLPTSDSPDEASCTLVSLLAAAKLAQCNYSWFPTRSMVVRWLSFAVELLRSPYAWSWNIKRGESIKPITMVSAIASNKPLRLCSSILDNLRSFAGDLHMMRDIAINACAAPLVTRIDKRTGRALDYGSTSAEQRAVMPLCHFVDFHCTTDFVFHMNPSVIETLGSDARPRPFAEVFSEIWKQSSSLNPRRSGRYTSQNPIKSDNVVASLSSSSSSRSSPSSSSSSSSSSAAAAASTSALALASTATAAAAASAVSASSSSSSSSPSSSATSASTSSSSPKACDLTFFRVMHGCSNDDIDPSPINTALLRTLREAQWLFLQTKRQRVQQPRSLVTTERYSLRCEFDVAWPSAMVGSIELRVEQHEDAHDASGKVIDTKGTKLVLVSLDPGNPYHLVAMRKPVRGLKSKTIDAQVAKDAIAAARQRLICEGVPMRAARAPIAAFATKTLFLFVDQSSGAESYWFLNARDTAVRRKNQQLLSTTGKKRKTLDTEETDEEKEEVMITKRSTKRSRKTKGEQIVEQENNIEEQEEEKCEEDTPMLPATPSSASSSHDVSVRWEDTQSVEIEYDVHEPIELTPWNALSTTGSGVVREFDSRFNKLLSATSILHLRRCIVILNGCGSEIRMNRLSREGRGLKQAVSIGDVGACQFLTNLSMLAPGALRPLVGQLAAPGTFRVGSGPLLWMVRDRVRNAIQGRSISHLSSPQPSPSSSLSLSSSVTPVVGWDRYNWVDQKKRVVRGYQTRCVDELIATHELGRSVKFLWQELGSGKTLISLLFHRHLAAMGQLPEYVLFATTKSAITHLIQEVRALGLEVHPLIPTKSTKKKAALFAFSPTTSLLDDESQDDEERDVRRMQPFCINIVEHDDLRRCRAQIVELGHRVVVTLDEADKMMNDSLRTSAALDVAKNAASTVLMTGTACIDSNLVKLTQWFSLCVNCEVTPRNAYAMASAMITNEAEIQVRAEHPDVPGGSDAVFAAMPGSRERYRALAPVCLGGTNLAPNHATFREACQLCWDAADCWTVQHMATNEPDRPSVFLTRGNEHSDKLKELLLATIPRLRPHEIYVLRGDNATYVTPETVRAGQPAYRCFIFPMSNSRGFELTAYDRFYRGVYFCNEATSSQALGRLIRMSSEFDVVTVWTPYCGLMENVHERHERSRSMNNALSGLKTYFINDNGADAAAATASATATAMESD